MSLSLNLKPLKKTSVSQLNYTMTLPSQLPQCKTLKISPQSQSTLHSIELPIEPRTGV